MKSPRGAAVLAALLLVSAPAAAEVGSFVLFPSCANTSGQHGAYFKTRLHIYNPNERAVTVFLGLGTPAGEFPADTFINIPAKSHYWKDDLLGEVFGYTGGGMVAVYDFPDGANILIATAEVYTEGPTGRYTTPVTGLLLKDKIPGPMDTWSAHVVGLEADASNRANFGCGNIDDVPATVTATISGWDGSKWTTETVDFDVPGKGWNQLAVPLQGEIVSISFKVKFGGGSRGTFCYGVKVNNVSNDGTAIPAQRFPPAK